MVKDSVTEAVFPAAVAQCMREAGADPDKFNIEKCSGLAECKKALTLLKVGKLPRRFH